MPKARTGEPLATVPSELVRMRVPRFGAMTLLSRYEAASTDGVPLVSRMAVVLKVPSLKPRAADAWSQLSASDAGVLLTVLAMVLAAFTMWKPSSRSLLRKRPEVKDVTF